MYSVDKTNFKSFLLDFPSQIIKTLEIFKNSDMNFKKKKFENIIYLGMGGSAISGDILKDALYDRLQLPLYVVRGYDVPAYCSDKSLVLAVSYSGNTEETLSAVKSATAKGAEVAVVTSGGELGDLADQNKWTKIVIPGGMPPRQSFGYLFFSNLLLLNHLNLVDVSEQEIMDIINLVKMEIKRFDEKTADGMVLPQELARQIQHNVPVIYATAPYFGSVAVRWKNQFQENSKSLAYSNVLPEMNHNEIVGWEMESAVMKNLIVIFLEFNNENKRIEKRIQLTKNIIREKKVQIAEIFAEGNSRLENAVSLVILGDWISYYLALCYGKNPVSILNIDYLKGELKKS